VARLLSLHRFHAVLNNFAFILARFHNQTIPFPSYLLLSSIFTPLESRFPILHHNIVRSCLFAMAQQEQANSAPDGGQNSAQNPPTPSSSSSISPYESLEEEEDAEEDIAIFTNKNHDSSKLHIEEPEESETEDPFAETSPIALPTLAGKNHANNLPVTTAAVATAEELVNTSTWTNLSRHAITNEMVFGPIPDREYHEGFMRKAIGMAQLALDSDETPVGCVFVRDGEVIGRGINGTNASLNVSCGTFSYFFVLVCYLGCWFWWVGMGNREWGLDLGGLVHFTFGLRSLLVVNLWEARL